MAPVYRQKHSVDGGRHGWLVVLGSHICSIFVFGLFPAIGPLLVAFQNYFEETSARTSWILAFGIFLESIIGPFSNVCIKKFGFRTTVVIGTITSSLGFFISVFTPRIEFLYFSIGVLVGVGHGLILPAHLGVLPLYIKKRFALANSLVMMGSGIGTFIFPPLLQMLIDGFGWKGALMIFSAVNAHMCISAALYRSSPVAKTAPNVEAGKTTQTRQSNMCKSVTMMCDFTLFVKYPAFAIFSASVFLAIGVGCQGFGAHYLARAETKRLGTPEQIALIVSIIGGCSLLGRLSPPLLLHLSNKHITSSRWAGITISATGIICLLSFLATTYTTYAICAALVGFLSGLFFVMNNHVMTDTVGSRNFTAAVGFTALFVGFGGLTGPPIAGYIYDVTGDYNYSFYFYGSFLTFGGIIMFLIDPCVSCGRKFSEENPIEEVVDEKANESQLILAETSTQTGADAVGSKLP